MAYAAVVSLAQILEQIMQHDHLFYIPQTDDDEQNLKSLQEKVGVLQGFLDHSRIVAETNQENQSLEAKIRDAAYKAQDIVEFHISDHHEIASRHKFSCGLWRMIPTSRNERSQTIQNDYEAKIMEALNQIDLVVDEANSMNSQRSSRVGKMKMKIRRHAPSLASSSNSTTSDTNKMVGFDEDLMKIKEVLCGESSRLKVVSILGMGGIGKTTLARNIFGDSYIAYYFHTCAWATVSQSYSLRGILLSVLHTLTLKTEEIEEFIMRSYLAETSDEELEEFVYKSLKGRTYLVVMDDMWSTEAWDDVGRIFPDDNNGSRVVITTRQQHVAEHASSSLIHKLNFLDKCQSWSLIRAKVFGEQSCPTSLEKIGKKIAERCGGLPLAIVVIAGVLAKVERSHHIWKVISENVKLTMAASHEHFSNILNLSYDYLPNHLKPCFLYMGSFVDTTEISVSKLIMLWVAEGFLRPVGSKSLEETAQDYLEDLIKRNLVLITEKGSNGRFKSCSVHDLLMDLCTQKAREEKFLLVRPSAGADISDQRRLALDSDNITNTFSLSLRSFLHSGYDCNIILYLSRYRLVRVLDIVATSLSFLPDEITLLFHLRYLAFAYEGYGLNLPKLQNLQTLVIQSHSYLASLGSLNIWKIPKLRHLVVLNAYFHLNSPPKFALLANIQTLSGVIDFKLTREAIDMLANLKKLKASYTRMSESKCRKLRLKNLDNLHELEVLNLAFVSAPSTLMMRMRGRPSIPFPSIYTLPRNLRKLTLHGCSPPSENMSVIGSLPNLEVLKLKEFFFVEEEWDPNVDEFQRLRFLSIELSNLVVWHAEASHFPCLEHLVITKCRRLEEIPRAVGDIATLGLIEVGPYSKSAAESALRIREEQESLGNDILQVRVYQEEWEEHLQQDSELNDDTEEHSLEDDRHM